MRDTGLAVPDPRTFADPASAPAAMRELHALAEASLAAETRQGSDAIDRELREVLMRRLAGDGTALAMALDGAPSVAVTRHLWRALDAAWSDALLAEGAAIAVTVFALPVVVVVAAADPDTRGALSGVIGDPEKLAGILGEFGALKGNRTFALANVLVAAEAIDIARLPEIRAWTRLPDAFPPGAKLPPRALSPAPLALHSGSEAVHLRFLVGTAIAKPGVDLLADTEVGKWGIPFARELARALGVDGVSVLALPRAPQRPMPAVSAGRAAQREVSAQLFASNAIRRFRGSVGEPTAVISAHRAPDAPGGGELRLSLSSPFDPRAAEGFRCPLYPLDRVGDVASMLVDLVRDCRVTDIRALAGVHADRVAGSGLPLLFKPDTIPDGAQVTLH
ncbi:MAG: hypothetical protein ABI724_08880 [Betaproteobacteria bacterium]